MRAKPNKAIAAARKARNHGRYIFIYNNLLTNQVVYSLTQSMKNNDALKQLAYFGKKSVPAALRKDVWAPLASVTFPHKNQGLDAYRKLREYRKLRDVTWDRDAEWMPLEKKRRKRALMDQKANSIADLAGILHKQEEFGRKTEADAQRVKQELEAKTAEEQREVESELKEFAERAGRGEPAEIEAKIEDLTSHMLGKKFPNQPAPSEGRKDGMAKKILELRQLKNSLRRAQEAVQNGTVADIAKQRVTRRMIDRALQGQAPKEVLYEQDIIKGSSPPPRFGRRRLLTLPKKVDYYSTEGVKISWANVMDTEFAESWPSAVQHTHMGFARHTAPSPWRPAQVEVPVRRHSPLDYAQREMRKEERRNEREARQKVSVNETQTPQTPTTEDKKGFSLRRLLPFRTKREPNEAANVQ